MHCLFSILSVAGFGNYCLEMVNVFSKGLELAIQSAFHGKRLEKQIILISALFSTRDLMQHRKCPFTVVLY